VNYVLKIFKVLTFKNFGKVLKISFKIQHTSSKNSECSCFILEKKMHARPKRFRSNPRPI